MFCKQEISFRRNDLLKRSNHPTPRLSLFLKKWHVHVFCSNNKNMIGIRNGWVCCWNSNMLCSWMPSHIEGRFRGYTPGCYVPCDMHMVVLYISLLWLYHCFQWVNWIYLPIFVRVPPVVSRPSYNCPGASKAALKDWPTPNWKITIKKTMKYVYNIWNVQLIYFVSYMTFYKSELG